MQFDFSTMGVAATERFAYWRDVVCQQCIPAASGTPHRDSFDARLVGRTAGPLLIAQLISPEHTWIRDASDVQNGPEDGFWLSYMETGIGHLEQSGKTVVQKAGDIMLYDAARPFTYKLAPESFFTLRIPRELLRNRTASAEKLVATSLGVDTGFKSVIGNLIKEVHSSSILANHPNLVAKATRSILDLVACVIDLHDGRIESKSVTEALFRRACDHIEKNLTNAEFSVDSLARSERVSSRTMARVFAAHGTTPMKYLWQKRLEASYCALAQGSVRQVSEAALDYGFSDPSHFSRMFKKAYGVSPRHVLFRY